MYSDTVSIAVTHHESPCFWKNSILSDGAVMLTVRHSRHGLGYMVAYTANGSHAV